MSGDRKASYKAPPAAVRDSLTSQEQRRSRALEEQKRRRAERFDATRQLDFFADMNLGPSDDDADEEDDGQGREIVRDGISSFASMLPTTDVVPSGIIADAAMAETTAPSESALSPLQASNVQTTAKKRGKSKRKGKGRQTDTGAEPGMPNKAKKQKPSKWADKCMYAELLEMVGDPTETDFGRDGVPEDIETGWVAVTPVPAGKRCIAVTHQASGIAGVVPNTTLRSRVLGKPLMKPFPTPLPPQTVLDCILDENWQKTGILHVLDVLQWKGQDVGDCETLLRFWWRDTRLSELSAFPPPHTANDPQKPAAQLSPPYQFPHPATFVPIPYHTDTTLAHLANTLIPLTRTTRSIPISKPVTPASSSSLKLDNFVSPLVQLESVPVEVRSDGLLLYVLQAAYEPGTSPLSSWIPVRAYSDEMKHASTNSNAMICEVPAKENPLDIFERLVRRRISLDLPRSSQEPEINMDLA